MLQYDCHMVASISTLIFQTVGICEFYEFILVRCMLVVLYQMEHILCT